MFIAVTSKTRCIFFTLVGFLCVTLGFLFIYPEQKSTTHINKLAEGMHRMAISIYL
ncbi:Uncharacterised protein [Grimontia hollisae]|nr:Uncharacterised protein [Grimontia hollisae]